MSTSLDRGYSRPVQLCRASTRLRFTAPPCPMASAARTRTANRGQRCTGGILTGNPLVRLRREEDYLVETRTFRCCRDPGI